MLEGACNWVLETPQFHNWYDGADTQLLWVKGDPGKGKTMMAIALINELSRRLQTDPCPGILSYSFCQNTGSRLNNAVSVLRGLTYILATKHDTIAKPLKDEFEGAGSKLFEGPNAFFDLRKILLAMLKIPDHGTIYLVVDALDERGSELAELLNLIINNEFTPPFRVKWLITGRNCEDIERQLRVRNPCLNLSLELNSRYVSHAVVSFLKENAEETFLWVDLACNML